MWICNQAKTCQQEKCPHVRPHNYKAECDKKLKESYGWPDGIGCYYNPKAECIEILVDKIDLKVYFKKHEQDKKVHN
jgi:hypothetical protein